MAVDKELLERDLYGLLGVGEKASEKEVRAAGGSGRAPSLLSPPFLSRCSRERRDALQCWAEGLLQALLRDRGCQTGKSPILLVLALSYPGFTGIGVVPPIHHCGFSILLGKTRLWRRRWFGENCGVGLGH